MDVLIILAVALLPVAVLFWYILKQDKYKGEPFSLLFKALALGVWSAVLAAALAYLIISLGIVPDSDNITSLYDAISISFLGAALPEELMKFLMFWVVVNKNKHFDEHVDGVVYASCVALGFAGIENILYLFGNTDEWVSVGIVRALLAVPMHWGCGILMGYYFSLVHFGLKNDIKTKVMILAAPILCHGIYDSLLFSVGVEPLLGLVLMPFLIFFLVKFHKRCRQKIVALLQSDMEVMLEQARREAEMQEDNVQ